MTTFGRRRRQDPLAGLPPELQRALDAAAAPGHASELTGLGAATAAFTSATLSERPVSWTLAKLVATPVAAVLAVTGLTGGVALAAATGHLPDGAQQLASRAGAPAPDRATTTRPDQSDQAGSQRSATATVALAKPTPGRCNAVTRIGAGSPAAGAAPLSGAGCAGLKAPGSQRSATATARLQAKPAKPAKAAKATRPAKPAKPARPVQAAEPADQSQTAPAGKPAVRTPAQRPVVSGSSRSSAQGERPAGAARHERAARPATG